MLRGVNNQMVMRPEKVKKNLLDIVDGTRCILEAQTGEREPDECKPVLRESLVTFCKIAQRTERKFSRDDPSYSIANFTGYGPQQMRLMGEICSSASRSAWPSCDALQANWDEYRYNSMAHRECEREIETAIRTRPIEKATNAHRMIRAFEHMRNYMHVSGYFLPDYVWVVPKRLREPVKQVFTDLASEKIESVKDLDVIRDQIEDLD